MNATPQDQFLSKAFAWFTGVVEDIQDPQQMGRVRVRCFGYHTDDKSQIRTEDLPWAFVVQPITSAAMSGLGTSPTGVLQGSWVVGFFRDGPSAQDPLILGTIGSIPRLADPQRGFSDPEGNYPIRDRIGSPDIPRQATGQYMQAPSYSRRKDLRVEKVETAVPPRVSSVANDEADSYYERPTWSNLDVDEVVSPSYPKNQATETPSGHVFEVDDTPNHERIAEMHASGTYREVSSGGDLTQTIVGDKYTVIFGADNLYIRGTCNITVDGDVRYLVKGDYHLEVEGNKTEYIKGSRQSKVGQSDQTEIGKELALNVSSNKIERVGGDLTLTVDGNVIKTIGGNCDMTVSGNNGFFILGDHQEFVNGNHESTSLGHMYLTSNSNIDVESNSETNISSTATNIKNNTFVTGTVDATTQVKVGAITLTGHRHTGVKAGLDTSGTPTA